MNLERIGISLKRIHFVRLSLICIVANLAAYFFLVIPRQENLMQLQSDYSILRSQIVDQQLGVNQLRKRLTNLEQSEKNLKEIYEKILVPRRTGVTEIRLEMEDLTRSFSGRRREFSYVYGTTSSFGLQPFTLAVPIQGTYQDIRQFINKIERSKHFLILDQVVLSSDREDNRLNLDFHLSTYLTDKEGI